MKKILYTLLTIFILLIVAIVFAANSSWVIKKAADRFAPDYNISYADITGNLFTGVKIGRLAFENRPITSSIRFSWDPSRILYKRIKINSVVLDDVDVENIKALIASFPGSEENTGSAPFPLVVNVGKVHVTVNPFSEQGIAFKRTVVDIEDLSYSADSINVGSLKASVDTNITDLELDASLSDRTLVVNALSLTDIDTEALESFIPQNESNSSSGEAPAEEEKKEPLNVLVPLHVELNNFLASVKPRHYRSVKIDRVELRANALKVDTRKILEQKTGAVEVGDLSLLADTNVSHIDIGANLKDDTVTLEHVKLQEIDTKALQALFAADGNTSGTEENTAAAEKDDTENSGPTNPLIPHYVVVKSLETSLLPAVYDPVHLLTFVLKGKEIRLDVQKLMVEKGALDLNGTTNLSNISFSSTIENNRLRGETRLTPNGELFTLYELPVRREAIGDIVIDLDASRERIVADLHAKAKHLLVTPESNESNATQFNVDIDSLRSHVVFTVEGAKLDADTKIMVTTPYAEDISLTNIFRMDGNISYQGEIRLPKIIGIDANMTAPVQNLYIVYKGDTKSIDTQIVSDGLKGAFVSKDMKKGSFHLETRKTLLLDKMVTLPAQIEGSKVDLIVDVPIDFENITPIKGKVKISSNLSNIDADIFYGRSLKVKAVSRMPEDSLLKNFDKNVKWDAVNPLNVDVTLGEENIGFMLKAKALTSDVKYLPKSGKVDGKITMGGLTTLISGSSKKKISVKARVNSFGSLMKSVQSFYTIDGLPEVEGGLDLSVDINELKSADLTLASPRIVYRSGRETEYVVNDVKMVLSLERSSLFLKNYMLTYQKMKIFATKPSKVSMKDNTVTLEPFWLNDQLQATGSYDLKSRKGKIVTRADKLHIAHEMIDLDSRIGIDTTLNGDATTVKGDITLLGGNVHYDLGKKSFASDSDIIIVQNMKKEEASPFMDNLSIHLKINSQKPLVYKQGPIDMKAYVDMTILKSVHSELMVLGEVKLDKGGSYDFQGKRFVVKKGNIFLTGDPNKPLLDIEVEYQATEHLITISVSGTPEAPVINFSSKPSLSREQILSVILFDSEEGAGSNSSEDMMKMMGGAMAKSALSDMGVKIDHLVLGQNGNVEIGKKLTDKITVIYINDEIPSVQVKYRHSKRTESIFEADEISQSYDIVYKRDMSADDIIIFTGGKKK